MLDLAAAVEAKESYAVEVTPYNTALPVMMPDQATTAVLPTAPGANYPVVLLNGKPPAECLRTATRKAISLLFRTSEGLGVKSLCNSGSVLLLHVTLRAMLLCVHFTGSAGRGCGPGHCPAEEHNRLVYS